jgi:hypothetical protein
MILPVIFNTGLYGSGIDSYLNQWLLSAFLSPQCRCKEVLSTIKRKVMENPYLSFQDEVRHQVCPVHQKLPSIEIIDGRIVLKCCCLDFKVKCYQIIIEALAAFKKDYPEKKPKVRPEMKIAFKKN